MTPNKNKIPRTWDKILHPLHVTDFYALQEDDKREAEIPGKQMLCAILYLETSNKSRCDELKKCVKNYYVLKKAEYPKTVTSVQSLLLN